MTTTTAETTAAHVAAEIRRRQRFVVASHARPDGDAIGSSLAMALALQRLGKQVRVVSRDRVPPQMEVFPGVDSIEVIDHVDDPGDAVIILECGDAQRTGIAGLEKGFVINIDHHPGNTMYGAMNWLDLSAAACGEMVFELIGELGVLTDARDRHARLHRDPDRHRRLPLLEHHAAHVRHLPPVRRSGRQCACGRAQHLRQQQPRAAEAVWRRAAPDAARSHGTHRHGVRRSADGPRVRRDLRRHRGPRQPSAHREGHRRGRVLQGERTRRLAREHAIEGRDQRQRHRA